MHRRSKFIIASFLTLGLVGSVVAYSKHDNHGFHVQKKLAKSLTLNDQQSAELDELVQALRDSRQQFKESNFMNPAEMLSLLEGEQMDQQKAMEIVRSKLDAIEQQAEVLIASTAGFTDSLSTDQRAQLQKMAQDKIGKHKQRRWHRKHGAEHGDGYEK